MKDFEYKIDYYRGITHDTKDFYFKILNQEGSKGWELVNIENFFWVFKRERPSEVQDSIKKTNF